MDAVAEWADRWGADQITLGVKETNPNALKFYEHLGYQDTGLRLHTPDDPKEVIIMFRRLKPEQQG
jgi:ribosomal protein S18 acetylase RimI-like enzyme